MIFRNNFYENNKRRRGDDIEHELRFKLLLTYVYNRYFFLSIPLIKLFQLWKMQGGRRISGTKFIRNSCAKGNFFYTSLRFIEIPFFLLFSRRKNRGMNGRTWPQCPAEFLREIIRRGQTNDTPYCALASRVKSWEIFRESWERERKERGEQRRRPERRSSAGHGLMKFNYSRRPGPR